MAASTFDGVLLFRTLEKPRRPRFGQESFRYRQGEF